MNKRALCTIWAVLSLVLMLVGTNSMHGVSFALHFGNVSKNIELLRKGRVAADLAGKDMFGWYRRIYGGRYPGVALGAKVGKVPLAFGGVAGLGYSAFASGLFDAFTNEKQENGAGSFESLIKLAKEHPMIDIFALGGLLAMGAGAYIYNEYSKDRAKFVEDANATYTTLLKGNALATADRQQLTMLKRVFELYKSAYSREQIDQLETLFAARVAELDLQAQVKARELPDALAAISAKLDRVVQQVSGLLDAAAGVFWLE